MNKNFYPQGFFNYAHRGASAYCAENTMFSFEEGLRMGANGIETDVQMTNDGVAVLFHDNTLDEATDGSGRICDLSFDELCRIRVTGRPGQTVEPQPIPTLEEFLKRYGKAGIMLAIELKQDGVEAETLRQIRAYADPAYVIVTSFKYPLLVNARAIWPDLRLGWLMKDKDLPEALPKAEAIGLYQLCPRATDVTAETVALWHEKGYDVRAWGVADETIMKHTVEMGMDGMTVNFPDKLTAFMKGRNA